MPSLPRVPTWTKRQNSQATLVNPTPPSGVDPSPAGILSDTASTKGTIYSAEPESESTFPPNPSQVSLVPSITGGLPPVSAARNLMQRKFSTATNNARKRTKDTSVDDQATRLKEENLALAAQVDDLRSQLAIREQELSESKLDGARVAEEKDGLAKQLDDVRSQLVVCEQDLSTSRTDATRITNENDALKDQVNGLQTELEDARARSAHVDGENNVLRSNVDQMGTRVGELTQQVDRLNKRLDELSHKIREMIGGFIIRWWVGMK